MKKQRQRRKEVGGFDIPPCAHGQLEFTTLPYILSLSHHRSHRHARLGLAAGGSSEPGDAGQGLDTVLVVIAGKERLLVSGWRPGVRPSTLWSAEKRQAYPRAVPT